LRAPGSYAFKGQDGEGLFAFTELSVPFPSDLTMQENNSTGAQNQWLTSLVFCMIVPDKS